MRLLARTGLVVLAAAPLGCSGDDAATADPASSPATSVSTVTGAASVSVAMSSPAPPPESTDASAITPSPGMTTPTIEPATPTTMTPSTTATTVAEGVVPGLPAIALLTGGSGLGARPLLRWEPVDGAAAYMVSVNVPGGGPLWAWEGATTEVPYGGGPVDDPDTTGARLLQPATWFVIARNADGTLLAASARVDIAP